MTDDDVNLDLEEHTPRDAAEARKIYAERNATAPDEDAPAGQRIAWETRMSTLATLAGEMSLLDGDPGAAVDMYLASRDHLSTALNVLSDEFEEVPDSV